MIIVDGAVPLFLPLTAECRIERVVEENDGIDVVFYGDEFYTPNETSDTSLEIEDALDDLPGWTYEDDRLKKTYEFSDFRAAISFIVRLSFYAEEMMHHPELENVYNSVSVALTTHDAGGKVTEKDVELASQIEDFAWV